MEDIIKEWIEKKREENYKEKIDKENETKEIINKIKQKYIKSYHDAIQFNLDRFLNKCEEITDTINERKKIDHNGFKNKTVVNNNCVDLDQQYKLEEAKKLEELNNEKIRLENLIEEKRKKELENIERIKREEIEMKKEMKKNRLEEERKRIRAIRLARRKGLNNNLPIW